MTFPRRELTGSTLELREVTLMVGKRLSRKLRTLYGPDCVGKTTEQHEVYEAIQIAKKANFNILHGKPELNEIPAILKVKTQLDRWSDKPDSCQCSEEIWNEICNLKAAENCKSAPKLLDYYIGRQDNGDILPGGYIAYIVMSKVPGKNLEGYGRMTKKEQQQVQIAFLDALCYIVDFEDVEQDSTSRPEDTCLDPWEHLGYWGLIGEDQVRDPVLFYSKDAVIKYYMEQLEQ
ncbi:uncharacterized protein BDV17DRAFT_288460 [Aspergillus undulatus]|uniref:uncharacterized protein n=1 Tax=Aspergillus undulatus TaxID=1810928 RepID=UPI003CCDECAD